MEIIKDKNTYLVYLMTISKENIILMDKLKIDKKDIETIKDLKYFIINKYKAKKFCPCQLIISEYFEHCIFCSIYNDTPKKKLIECFPKQKIYINIILEKICDCDFENLNSLSKLEIYENFMEKIKKLTLKYKMIINEKEKKIEDMEKTLDAILNNNKNETCRGDEPINNNPKNNIIINQYNDNIKSEEFYDIIINIKSIKEMIKGWEIKMTKIGQLRFEEYKNKKALIIGVLGNSNKGKSFLLSKISKIKLPYGTSIRTEGLSIKYPELEKYKNRKIILLDSEGLEGPLIFNNEENRNDIDDIKLKEKARDKIITELFLQNFIIYNSDLLITVVGILNFQEQKMINKIKKEISKSKTRKTLYVIHNLMTYTTVEQVQNYINNILINSASFELERRTLITTKIIDQDKKVEYFSEEYKNLTIFHLIFANDGSDAGKFYNKFALDFIENSFQSIINIKPFDIIQSLKERFIEISSDLIENDKNSQLILEKDFLSNEDILKEKTIRLIRKRDIILKRCFIDELGFSNLRSSGFNPYYNCYRKDDIIIVKIEAPGNISLFANYKYSGNFNIIVITGTKMKDKEYKGDDIIVNSREYGDFSIEIPLLEQLDNKSPNIIKKNGIIKIEFAIRKNNNHVFKYEGNEEEEI